MRISHLLCFIGLIALASAKHSKMSLALKEFAAFAQDDELDHVSAILAEVEAELQRDYDLLSGHLDAENSAYSEAYDRYRDWKVESAQELEKLGEELNAAEVIAADLNEAIRVAASAINAAQSQIDALEAQREVDHAAFSERSAALEKAITAAQEALQLVIEVSEKDLGASFLQINSKKATKAFTSLAHKLNKHNAGQLSTTMAQLLAEATADGINSEIAGKLVELIENLIVTLENELDAAVQFENQQVEQTNDAINNNNEIISVETRSANINQFQLGEVEWTIENLSQSIDYVSKRVEEGEHWWRDFKAAHEEHVDNFEKLLKRLRGDFAALKEAEKILEENQ